MVAPPCVLCGTTGGKSDRGRIKRIDGGRYGVMGLICWACYARKGRPSTRRPSQLLAEKTYAARVRERNRLGDERLRMAWMIRDQLMPRCPQRNKHYSMCRDANEQLVILNPVVKPWELSGRINAQVFRRECLKEVIKAGVKL